MQNCTHNYIQEFLVHFYAKSLNICSQKLYGQLHSKTVSTTKLNMKLQKKTVYNFIQINRLTIVHSKCMMQKICAVVLKIVHTCTC